MEIADERLFKVQAGVQGLLSRRRVTGWSVEVIVGHLTFCGLANRGLLTVLHTVYRFMRRRYLEAVELWPECRAELRTCAALLYLARASWTTPWNEVVYQSDASESGWGVKTAWWPLREVQRCGRLSERQRVRRTGTHTARESALGAAWLQREGGQWMCHRIDEDDPLVSDLVGCGPELRGGQRGRCGQWDYYEDIMLLEARAFE